MEMRTLSYSQGEEKMDNSDQIYPFSEDDLPYVVYLQEKGYDLHSCWYLIKWKKTRNKEKVDRKMEELARLNFHRWLYQQGRLNEG